MNFSFGYLFLKGVLLFISLLLIKTPAYPQREYDLLGKGARAAGMAYAFYAVADDATAISWNPAGIAQIKNPEIAIVNSIASTEYRHAIKEYDFKPIYSFDYLGFVYPLNIKNKALTFGISFQNKMNYKFRYENLPSIFSERHGSNKLTVNAVSLCGAYSIARFLNIGISYNRWFSIGNEAIDYELVYTKKLYESDTFPDKTTYVLTEHFNYTGNNLSAGVLFVFPLLKHLMQIAIKYEGEFVLKNLNNFSDRVDHIWNDQEDTAWVDFYKGTWKYEFPGILSAGLSYRTGDYLILACDVDLKLYNNNVESWDYSINSRKYINDQKDFEIDTIGFIEGPFQHDRLNLNQYRIGMEYILHPKFGLIPVRTGWKINPTSINTYDENFNPTKKVLAHSFNIGTGLILKNTAIDLAYEPYWYKRMDEDFESERKVFHFLILSAIWHF